MSKKKTTPRSHIGYGSSYHRVQLRETDGGAGIESVLGGQKWVIHPDHKALPENPCLWMQAGAVKYKTCNNFYDCTTCRYDHAMQTKVSLGKQVSWQDTMRRQPALARTCRHSLTGRIGHRSCAYDFHCEKCDFDQYFEDVLAAKTRNAPTAVTSIKGFDVPRYYHFHNGHTWARIESGGTLRVGLDDFSQKVFGQADGLELPLMGKQLDHDQVGWGLKRKHHLADVRSPIDGVIMEVNTRVMKDPGLANRDPYGDGWLFVVHTPSIKKAAKRLMSEDASVTWINSEVAVLEEMVTDVAGPLAADGGTFGSDIYGNLPGLDWNQLARTFLKTG
ncbi:glycine cleavage system protein H [Desulfosarcina variabilis]|uniref:glycine cleavage system protein H n=1 Tax=Desulfosarcina variabilis TaxID=2300 RepID=UPI003AFAEBE1